MEICETFETHEKAKHLLLTKKIRPPRPIICGVPPRSQFSARAQDKYLLVHHGLADAAKPEAKGPGPIENRYCPTDGIGNMKEYRGHRYYRCRQADTELAS